MMDSERQGRCAPVADAQSGERDSEVNTRPRREAIERLQARLQEVASEKTKEWRERYMKGAASFRGVPMAAIRSTLKLWYVEEGLDDAPASIRRQVALDLLAESYSEDKLAGVLLMREHILTEVTVDDLPSFAAAFRAGHIADWGICDWFSVKVLAALVERDGRRMAEAIAFDPSTVADRARRKWHKAGLDGIGLHECRHTFAALMIAAGVNAKALSTYWGTPASPSRSTGMGT